MHTSRSEKQELSAYVQKKVKAGIQKELASVDKKRKPSDNESCEVQANTFNTAFDDDIPVTLEAHLFTSEKLTYYTLKDGLPQAEHFDIQTSQQPD